MHELAIAQNVIRIVESEKAKQGFTRVCSIKLAVGEVSGVIPECLYEFFPIAAKGTAAEGAVVTAETIPVAIRCNTCGHEGRPERGGCEKCGGSDIKLVSGREFFVESIEVE